jgi:hypothetical protein
LFIQRLYRGSARVLVNRHLAIPCYWEGILEGDDTFEVGGATFEAHTGDYACENKLMALSRGLIVQTPAQLRDS